MKKHEIKILPQYFVDYWIAKECKNHNGIYMCQKCGKCGRIFVKGIIVDDGGTTDADEE